MKKLILLTPLLALLFGGFFAHDASAQNRTVNKLKFSTNFEFTRSGVSNVNQAILDDGTPAPIAPSGENVLVVDTFYAQDHLPESPYPKIPSQESIYGDGNITDPDKGGYLYVRNTTAYEVIGDSAPSYDPAVRSSSFAHMDMSACTHGYADVKVQFMVLEQGTETAYGSFWVRKDRGPWVRVQNYNQNSELNAEDVQWRFYSYTADQIMQLTNGFDLRDADCIEIGFGWENSGGEPLGDNPRISFGVDDVRVTGVISQNPDDLPTITARAEVLNGCACTPAVRLFFTHDRDLCGALYTVVMSAPGGSFENGAITLINDAPQFMNEDDCETIVGGLEYFWTLVKDQPLPQLVPGECYRFRISRRLVGSDIVVNSDLTACITFDDPCPSYAKTILSPPIDGPTACSDLPVIPDVMNPGETVRAKGEICMRSVIDVNYWADGCFYEDNFFVAELSDINGNFDNPATINSIPGPDQRNPEGAVPPGPGVVNGIIPTTFDNGAPIEPGCGYYLRVYSTNQELDPETIEPWGPFCIRDCSLESNTEVQEDSLNPNRIQISLCMDHNGHIVEPERTEKLDSCFLVPFTFDFFGNGVTYTEGNKVQVQLYNAVTPPMAPFTSTRAVLIDGEIAEIDSASESGILRICMPTLDEMLFDPEYAGLLPPRNFYFRLVTDGSSDPDDNCGTFNYFSYGISNPPDSLELYFLSGLESPLEPNLLMPYDTLDEQLCINDYEFILSIGLAHNFWSQKKSSYEFYFLAAPEELDEEQLETFREEFINGVRPGFVLSPPDFFNDPFMTTRTDSTERDSVGLLRFLLNDLMFPRDATNEETEGIEHVYIIAREISGGCPSNSATRWLRVDYTPVPENPFSDFADVCLNDTTVFEVEYIPGTAWFWYPDTSMYPKTVLEQLPDLVSNNKSAFLFKEPGFYTVEVQLAHPCYNMFFEETIEVVPYPKIDAPDTLAYCLGQEAILTAGMEVQSGLVGTEWDWSEVDESDTVFTEVDFDVDAQARTSEHRIRRAAEDKRFRIILTNDAAVSCIDTHFVDMLVVEAEESNVGDEIVCLGDAAEIEVEADRVEWEPHPALLAGPDAKNQVIAPDSSEIFRYTAFTQEYGIECQSESQVAVYVLKAEQDLMNASLVCGNAPVVLKPLHPNYDGLFYTWYEVYDSTRLSRVRGIDSTFTVDKPGTYRVQVRKDRQSEPCFEITWRVQFIQTDPVIEIELETCEGDEVTLDPVIRGSIYLWNTGETTPTITVSAPGIYTVSISSPKDSCSATYTYEVRQPEECTDGILDVPNAFSPNGDGENDYWRIWVNGLERYDLNIYDRWGNHIHHEERERAQFDYMPDPITGANYGAFKWDGRVDGGEPREGVYVYVIEAETVDGQEVQLVGTVTLVH